MYTLDMNSNSRTIGFLLFITLIYWLETTPGSLFRHLLFLSAFMGVYCALGLIPKRLNKGQAIYSGTIGNVEIWDRADGKVLHVKHGYVVKVACCQMICVNGEICHE